MTRPVGGRMVAIAFLGAVALGSACMTARRTTSSPVNRAVIQEAELDASRAPSVLEVVRQLRPEWLQRASAGVRSIGGVDGDQLNVYVDNTRYVGAAVLGQLSPNGVREIRFLSASEAQMRFGEGNTGGVIHVITRSGIRP